MNITDEQWVEGSGIMEDWNDGMLGKLKNTFFNPLFHCSTIPLFQL
jgi:hypothetical protein